MPCSLLTGDELDHFPVATQQEMRGNAHALELREVRMRLALETIGEKLDDRWSAEFGRRQADRMDDDQRHRLVVRAGVVVR